MEVAIRRVMHEGAAQRREAGNSIVLRRSFWAEIPNLMICAGLVAGAWWFTREFPESVVHATIGGVGIHIQLAYAVPVVFFLLMFHRLYNSVYVITDRYVRAIDGALSLRKRERFIEFHNIRAIEIDRGLLERIVNIGDLRIASAAYSNVEIQLRGISDPSHYRDIIMARTRVEIRDLYESNGHQIQEAVASNGESFTEGSYPPQNGSR